jgi:hypothetical protein
MWRFSIPEWYKVDKPVILDNAAGNCGAVRPNNNNNKPGCSGFLPEKDINNMRQRLNRQRNTKPRTLFDQRLTVVVAQIRRMIQR